MGKTLEDRGGALTRIFLSFQKLNSNLESIAAYAVVGAASFMGGATRMTLTTTVMVMETTGEKSFSLSNF